MSEEKVKTLFETISKFDSVEIKNRVNNLEEKILFDLKLNVGANKEISSVTKDEKIIQNSYYLIPDYLVDFNLCQKCISAYLKIRDCLHNSRMGFRLTPKLSFNKLDFVYSTCSKYNKLKNEIMSKINLYYDDELSFYLQGSKLIYYYIDLNNSENVKKHSEISLLFDYIHNEIISKKDFNKSGYLISSKKEGLSTRVLKAIALYFVSLNVTITYIDAETLFSFLYEENNDQYENVFTKAINSKVLLINNLDKIKIINESLTEKYLETLITKRDNEGFITFASTSKPVVYSYLTKMYFNNSINKPSLENSLKRIFKLITITDSI